MSLLKHNAVRVLGIRFLVCCIYMAAVTQVSEALGAHDGAGIAKYLDPRLENFVGYSGGVYYPIRYFDKHITEVKNKPSNEVPLAVELEVIDDDHDPNYLFEQLNRGGRIDYDALRMQKLAHKQDATADMFAELDRYTNGLNVATGNDYINSYGFKNFKDASSQQLQDLKKQELDESTQNKNKLNQKLYAQKKPPDARLNYGYADTIKHASAGSTPQRDRLMQRIESDAADREFERVMNMQQERFGGENIVYTPMNVLYKPPEFCRVELEKSTTCPSTLPPITIIECTTQPPPSTTTASTTTCPTTTTTCTTTSCTTEPPQTTFCIPEKCQTTTTKSPSCSQHVVKSKPLQVEQVSLEQLLRNIRELKKHAILILGHLNEFESEILSRSTDNCLLKKTNTAVKSKQQQQIKYGQRLNRPLNNMQKGLFFGLRAYSADDTKADLIAARNEEQKLELRVRKEHEKLMSDKHIKEDQNRLHTKHRQYLHADKDRQSHALAWPIDWTKSKRARYEAAPAAAARLMPNLSGNEKKNKTAVKPSRTGVRTGSPLSSAMIARATPITYSVRNHELVINKNQSQGQKKGKRKGKKQKMVATVILSPQPLGINTVKTVAERRLELKHRHQRKNKRRQHN